MLKGIPKKVELLEEVNGFLSSIGVVLCRCGGWYVCCK